MLTFNETIEIHSKNSNNKIAVKDSRRNLTYSDIVYFGTNLASFLAKLGIVKKDRIALLAFNCSEFVEIKYATSKLGAIIVPINFRLNLEEIIEVIKDSKPNCIIFDSSFVDVYKIIKKLKLIKKNNFICINKTNKPLDCYNYHNVIKTENINKFGLTHLNDEWSLMYTSGTTGKPKGVVRSHKGYYLLSTTTAIELSISKSDEALLVMPLCHANSFNFFCAYLLVGASITIYDKESFDPYYFFFLISKYKCNCTSLVPTHFIIILEYLKLNRMKSPLEKNFTFMISSAPARRDTKYSILEHFPNAKLFELYGSSESGWVTMLKPEEQFAHLGTVGKECIGSKPIKILNSKMCEVKVGEVGELYASTSYNFSHYWNNKKATEEAFFNDYVTVGDLALRNTNGYIELVDRKKNMIISGGENIYPMEVENILGSHRLVKDVAVIGYPDEKWGESVCAFVVLEKDRFLSEQDLISWSKEKLAGYKCPKKVIFLKDKDMPRNATGKILHKKLRENFKFEQRLQ